MTTERNVTNSVFLLGAEDTPGVAAVLDATQHALDVQAELAPEAGFEFPASPRPVLGSDQPAAPRKPRGKTYSYPLQLELYRAAPNGMLPGRDVLLAMGFTEVGGPGSGMFGFQGGKTVSAALLQDGIRYPVRGARADGSITFEAGQTAKLEATVSGATDGPKTTAMPPLVIVAGTGMEPILCDGMTLEIAGLSVEASRFTISTGNAVVRSKALTAPGGLKPSRVSGRAPRFTTTVFAGHLSEGDWEAIVAAAERHPLHLGDAVGELVSGTSAVVESAKLTYVDGVPCYELEGGFYERTPGSKDSLFVRLNAPEPDAGE